VVRLLSLASLALVRGSIRSRIRRELAPAHPAINIDVNIFNTLTTCALRKGTARRREAGWGRPLSSVSSIDPDTEGEGQAKKDDCAGAGCQVAKNAPIH